MNPMENGDFLGQIAQFSMVTGLQQLNDAFSQLSSSISSSQALQAGSLVGKSVMTQGQYGVLSAEQSLEGELNLTSSASDLEVRIYDAVGVLQKTLNMGTQASGTVPFKWDGQTDSGAAAPVGIYRVEADALGSEGREALQTLISSTVESVVVGSAAQGLTLNLAGLGSVAFNDVAKIQ
jgi:flagellar basal-body rod modification protein FlgD